MVPGCEPDNTGQVIHGSFDRAIRLDSTLFARWSGILCWVIG